MGSTHTRRLLAATALTAGAIAVGIGSQSVGAIVDGTETSASENPWQVALVDSEGQFCGGSLIDERVVLTAAHCVVGMSESDIQVRAGVSDLTSGQGQTRSVTTVVEHANYAETGPADIAMLVLDRPFDRSSDIAVIPTATADEVARATTARVTGWGSTSETAEDTPPVLLSADVPIVDDQTCSTELGSDPDDELCAGGTGPDSCYGDSGGPLTIDTARGRVLAGVVSWGEECGGSAPGVYAEVPTFNSWIEERLADPDAPGPDRLPADAGEEFDEWGDDEYWDDELGEWDDEWAEWDDDGSWDDERPCHERRWA